MIKLSWMKLTRIEDIVRGAVGYNELRGDVVTVVASKFARPVEELDDPWYLEPDKQRLRQNSIGLRNTIVHLPPIARPFIKSSSSGCAGSSNGNR